MAVFFSNVKLVFEFTIYGYLVLFLIVQVLIGLESWAAKRAGRHFRHPPIEIDRLRHPCHQLGTKNGTVSA